MTTPSDEAVEAAKRVLCHRVRSPLPGWDGWIEEALTAAYAINHPAQALGGGGDGPPRERTEQPGVPSPAEPTLPCPHRRPSWRQCPWCLGINGPLVVPAESTGPSVEQLWALVERLRTEGSYNGPSSTDYGFRMGSASAADALAALLPAKGES